ncbi:protein FAM8A1-like [Brachionichthys hirsutus]|uniref:protein FAM8A1-like n=1 Tax=Brachionichthys hirsutus TaxID=412623 RepID=UPI003604EA8B
MAAEENTNTEAEEEQNITPHNEVEADMNTISQRLDVHNSMEAEKHAKERRSTTEYCAQLQAWMWQYYSGYGSWQSWLAASAMSSCPYLQSANGMSASHDWYGGPFALSASSPSSRAGGVAVTAQPPPPPQERGNAQRPGREYSIPSPAQRLLAEMMDFFILFFIKATIIISMMHLSGIKDVSKFAMHFIVEEIDEDTSMEELQKMMLVALVYRMLVCFYEIVCIWGAGGATPGKFLIGLRVVTCDSSVLVQPNRVVVVPATNVSLSGSIVRALNKNFSIAFFFPAFITLLFFQHNRTVYDMVAGTIVVKRPRIR